MKMKEFTELKDLQDLLLFERTYTGATQSMFAAELSDKYETKITLGQLNSLEHSKKDYRKEEDAKKKSEMSFEDILKKEFYNINIKKEKELVSLAYEIALTFIRRNISIDIEELFSCTTKNDLIDFICLQIIKEKPFGIEIMVNEKETKVSIQNLINKIDVEGAVLSEIVDITPTDINEEKMQVGYNLNDTAKFIFYIGYYYLLLSHTEEKIFTKEELSQNMAEFTRICHIDNYENMTSTAKSKIAKNINMRFSLYKYIQRKLKKFHELSFETIEKMPVDEESADVLNPIKEYYEYYMSIDTEKEETPSPGTIDKIYSLMPTLRAYITSGFAFYQGEGYLPCLFLTEKFFHKFKENQNYFGSQDVKKEVSDIMADFRSKYSQYQQEPTVELFVYLVGKQRYLFQLYKMLNVLKSIKDDL